MTAWKAPDQSRLKDRALRVIFKSLEKYLRSTLEGGWTAYTPEWSATTTAPAVNNGTHTGYYKVVGKTLFVRTSLVMGSLTTYGAGSYRIHLPSGYTSHATGRQLGVARAYDASGTTRYQGVMRIEANSAHMLPELAAGATSPTVPFTWAQDDELAIQAVIEIA